jgi:alpha-galactosidase
MGWSEWDAYGLTINEADFRANAAVLAGLRSYGWQYTLLDAGWYEQDPASHDAAKRNYVLDANGRLIPPANRFPSAADGAGFKPLADWLHARGLKLGIHVMLGIPRQAVEGNLPIAGSEFRAADAAESAQTCSWDKEFFVVKDDAAGQAWYDSIARQYAAWGIDFIKLGCVADHPFHPSEIRQMREAIRKTGRPMVLSLSPGPLPQDYMESAAHDAQMVRVSPEHWDLWLTPAGKTFPVGLRDDFDLLAQWASWPRPGSWIDPDALPDSWLAPHPAWGEARHTQLTPDEQRSQFALWIFARAPLIEGANLTRLDPLARRLMTSRDLIAIDQNARTSHPLTHLPPGFEHARVWEAEMGPQERTRPAFAFFNLDDHPATLHITWLQLGLTPGKYAARDLWSGERLQPSAELDLQLRPHGSSVLQVQ